MTNPLDILKSQLTDFLDKSDQGEDFNQAVEDGIYACGLGSFQALNEWISIWIHHQNLANETEQDLKYMQGVAFVEDQWNKITGMF